MAKTKAKKKPKAEPTCFIIMPISRPSAMADLYPDGPDHFTNILKSLFIPSVEAAGFKPDPPTASGSEIIQARIIKKLIDADMVLCDMSCLNANVFFEFGIRTALNKPVCVVKDSQSPDVAFDTSIIHYHEYQSPLYAHQTAGEIKSLTSHIQDTWTRNDKTNAMWQALGFQLTAQVAQPSGEPNDHILQMLAGIANRLDGMDQRRKLKDADDLVHSAVLTLDEATQSVHDYLYSHNCAPYDWEHLNDNTLSLNFSKPPPKSTLGGLFSLAKSMGLAIRITFDDAPPSPDGHN